MITPERVYDVFGITQGPWYGYLKSSITTIVSKYEKNHYVQILMIKKDPVVLKETWDRQQRDHKLITSSPEMLVALVNLLIVADQFAWPDLIQVVKAIESADSKNRPWPELLKALEG